MVIDVFGNMSLNDALSVRFKELEMLNENIVKAKIAAQIIYKNNEYHINWGYKLGNKLLLSFLFLNDKYYKYMKSIYDIIVTSIYKIKNRWGVNIWVMKQRMK